MRKRIREPDSTKEPQHRVWLDLEPLAEVEITSEAGGHPIEAALLPQGGSGWRAARAGEQSIRIRFDQPQRIQRIHLVFQENDVARTQEFLLSWSRDGGESFEQIVRQQYNFAPPGTTREIEDCRVDLDAVTDLKLSIVPDVSGGNAVASLEQLRLA